LNFALKAFQKNKSKTLIRKLNPDKAKPSVRRGQKVAGLSSKMAELPKDETLVSSAFLFLSYPPG
jgi:hypothetical protein